MTEDREKKLPVKVIRHQRVVRAQPDGLSKKEQQFTRWLDEHEPEVEEDLEEVGSKPVEK